MEIALLGYTPRLFRKKHTNYWPWKYLETIFSSLGYKVNFIEVKKINRNKPYIYICWNKPDTIKLIEKYTPHKDSIIIQKLTSFDESTSSDMTWTDNPKEFFARWHWPQYQKLDYLQKSGYRYYGFGAKTTSEGFKIKEKLVNAHADRIFWIPWGSMTVPYNELMKSTPILEGFKYDLGFVGSRWGTLNRGNIREWDSYLQPLIDQHKCLVAGKGTQVGVVDVKKHIEILRASKLCPIIHATSWKVEKGIMDRFWTVFSLGRFGVCDNEGILDFYNENEVVLARSSEEYLDKSEYYIKNPAKQKKYIEHALKRIKKEYNQKVVWANILNSIQK